MDNLSFDVYLYRNCHSKRVNPHEVSFYLISTLLALQANIPIGWYTPYPLKLRTKPCLLICQIKLL